MRIGNDACRQVRHDMYGSAILAATHVFFDGRLVGLITSAIRLSLPWDEAF